MKRFFAMLFTLLLIASCAAAEIREFKMGNGEELLTAECMTFEGELPSEVKAIFASRLLEDDVILSGAKADLFAVATGELWSSEALLAVRRGEKVLIMGAKQKEDGWHAYVETDSFLGADTPFSIGVEWEFLGDTALNYAWLAIQVEDSLYYVQPTKDGIELESCIKRFAGAGDERVVTVNAGRGLRCEMRKEGEIDDVLYVGRGAVPTRLGAWQHERFPKDETEAEYYHLNHAFVLKEDEAFICSVNLREKPTGQSASWGEYTARVKVLGSEPGLQMPWYNVQVGNLTGWVSGAYLFREEDDDTRYYSTAAAALPVARAKGMIALRERLGEKDGQKMADGTLMHVLQEKDGWLHVIVPRYGFDWQVDWYGAYGFVKADEVVTGVSPADVLYP